MAIDAKHKWALTGTPFVNKPDDIQSLLQFLGVQPFDCMERFKQYVTEPIMNKRAIGLKRLRVATSFCAFRRTKDHVKTVVKLPKKVVVRTLVDFGEGEHATNHNMFYDTLRAILRKILSNDREKTKGGIALLFTMLIRIKQSCCHAELVPEVVRELAVAAHEQRDEIDDPLVLLAMMKTPDDVDTQRSKLGPDFNPRSPKIVALLEQITAMGDGEKGVIFSQFTSYLDIVEKALLSANHTFTRIDGSLNWKQREEAMTKFSTERCDSFETPRFILCSLMACGTGITLTRGNHVFMMDPWWNSSVEMQAYDRVHRVGQTREVRVVRFMMKDSIEERMVAFQEAKQALGKGSLEKMSKTDQEKAKLTTLKDLFQITEEEADNNWDWLVDDDDVEDEDEDEDKEWRGYR